MCSESILCARREDEARPEAIEAVSNPLPLINSTSALWLLVIKTFLNKPRKKRTLKNGKKFPRRREIKNDLNIFKRSTKNIENYNVASGFFFLKATEQHANGVLKDGEG